MQKFIDILAVPGCAFCGYRATVLLWPLDQFLSGITAMAFFLCFCQFVIDVLPKERAA